jgi:alkylation response protein AidB-like acyl-CoA dehydrogenase
MPDTTLPPLRRRDYSLDDVQTDLRDSMAQFFERECPSTVVRDAEPLGFDAKLWTKVREVGLLSMALPESSGGDGAGVVELVLALEEFGRRLAPVPLIEQVVALRALAASGQRVDLDAYLGGERIVTFAPRPQRSGRARLVPNAAVADGIVGLVGDELVLVEPNAPAPLADTIGGAPLGWCDLAAVTPKTVLGAGAAASAQFEQARLEWKLATAAALVGLARGALDITVQYANERYAFGVPIGTFQALSHRLVDVRVAIEGTRRLVWRAAWYLDHEPDLAALHVMIAYLRACETANFAPTQGIHTQGGFGFTLESDLHLYFRRAKAWPLVAGDPTAELTSIADLVLGPRP